MGKDITKGNTVLLIATFVGGLAAGHFLKSVLDPIWAPVDKMFPFLTPQQAAYARAYYGRRY